MDIGFNLGASVSWPWAASVAASVAVIFIVGRVYGAVCALCRYRAGAAAQHTHTNNNNKAVICDLREELRVAHDQSSDQAQQVQRLQQQVQQLQHEAQRWQRLWEQSERRKDKVFPLEVWASPTGGRYHIGQACGGRASRMYTPCMTCVH